MKKQLILSLSLFSLLTILLVNCKKKEDPAPSTPTTPTNPVTATAPAIDNAANATTSNDLTATSAKVSSTLSANGGAAISQYGHVWSETNAAPTTADTKTELGATSGPFPLKFTSELKNLKANTIYNVRAYATNDKGTTYGTDVQVKTTAGTSTASLADWKTARSLGEGFDFTRTNDLLADNNGNFYLSGTYNKAGKIGKFSTGSGNGGFVAKLDAAGEPLWVIELTGTSSNDVYDLDMDAAGNLYAALSAGTRNTTFGSFTLPNFGSYMAKINPDGKVEWVRSFGIKSGSTGSLGATHVDAEGNSYVIERLLGNQKATIGTTTVTGSDPAWVLNNGTEGWDQVIARFDPSGKLLWSRLFSGTGQQDVYFDVDPNGAVYVGLRSFDGVPSVGGTALTSSGEFLLKLSSGGSLEWSKNITTTKNPHINGISCHSTGEFVVRSAAFSGISIGGATTTSANSVILAVFRQDGSTKWATALPIIHFATFDKSGNLYTVHDGPRNNPFTIGDITLPAQTPETQYYMVVAKYNPMQNKWLWAIRNKSVTGTGGPGSALLAVSSTGVPLLSLSIPTGDIQFSNTIKATMSSRFGAVISTIEQK
jgi:hypothetical protein